MTIHEMTIVTKQTSEIHLFLLSKSPAMGVKLQTTIHCRFDGDVNFMRKQNFTQTTSTQCY